MHYRRFLSCSAAVRVVVLLAVACAISAVTSLATTTISLPQSTAPTYRTQLGIVTTSDWTTVRLLSGGSLQDLTVISASAHALSAGLDGDILSLSQSLTRAEAGQSVELVVEVLIAGLEPEGKLVFGIDRGQIGSTQVEISSYQDGTPRVIAVLTWDGISSGGRNTQVFDVSSEALIGTRPNEHIVIAQLNFWYYGPGQGRGFGDGKGNRETPLNPLLGDYWSNDPSVVYQQIEWAVEYGVDAFSIEWTIPRGMISCCASMEDTLDDVFLKSPNVHKIRWVIFYDFVLRMDQTPGLDVDLGHIDFDQPEVYDIFVSDFVHFAKKYFGHPQYLIVDGRPVIYIWATNSYIGDLASAIQEARERVSELGFDVFIVGDEVCVGCFDVDHAALFDGSSTFTFLIPGLDVSSWADVGDAAVAVDGAFQWWPASTLSPLGAAVRSLSGSTPGTAGGRRQRSSPRPISGRSILLGITNSTCLKWYGKFSGVRRSIHPRCHVGKQALAQRVPVDPQLRMGSTKTIVTATVFLMTKTTAPIGQEARIPTAARGNQPSPARQMQAILVKCHHETASERVLQSVPKAPQSRATAFCISVSGCTTSSDRETLAEFLALSFQSFRH